MAKGTKRFTRKGTNRGWEATFNTYKVTFVDFVCSFYNGQEMLKCIDKDFYDEAKFVAFIYGITDNMNIKRNKIQFREI